MPGKPVVVVGVDRRAAATTGTGTGTSTGTGTAAAPLWGLAAQWAAQTGNSTGYSYSEWSAHDCPGALADAIVAVAAAVNPLSAYLAAEPCTVVLRVEPATFKAGWRAFSNRVIRLGHRSVALLCDAVAVAADPAEPDEDTPYPYNAVGPNPAVEKVVFQVLEAIGSGRSGVEALAIRFDSDEDICISIVIALVQYAIKHAATGDNQFSGLTCEAGSISAMAFDAIAKKVGVLKLKSLTMRNVRVDASTKYVCGRMSHACRPHNKDPVWPGLAWLGAGVAIHDSSSTLCCECAVTVL